MRRTLPIVLLVSAAVSGCGGGGGSPAQPPAPAATPVSGLVRAVGAAQGAVSQSQRDALRASQTSAGQ